MTALQAIDLDGRPVTISIGSIRGIVPDEEFPDATLLFLDENTVVKVMTQYDELTDQLTAAWGR